MISKYRIHPVLAIGVGVAIGAIGCSSSEDGGSGGTGGTCDNLRN